MFDLEDLGGQIGDVLAATRVVTDPWGYGITATIKATTDPDWKQWELERAANSPAAQQFRETQAEVILAPSAPAGFRSRRKMTEAEGHKRLVKEFAKPGGLKTDLLALRERKPGIARLLVVSMGGVLKAGQPVDLSTAEARERLMDHAAYEFKGPGGEPLQRATPRFKRLPGGALELDSAGEPVEFPYGGQNFGDALAGWLFDECELTAAFVVEREMAVLEPSGAGSTLSTGSGTPSSPQDNAP